MVQIEGTTAVVTGGQRGLGRALTTELLRRGATKVYVTARSPRQEDDPRIVAVAVDVTDQTSIDALAAMATDARIVINNAGIAGERQLLSARMEDVIAIFETNVFGALRVAQAFAPVLSAAPGSALVDIHSVMSWAAGSGAYGASKAAIWSMTNTLRLELRGAGVQVTGVHVSYIDTDMSVQVAASKMDAAAVAVAVVAGIETGKSEVIVDPPSSYYKQRLAGPVEGLTFDATMPTAAPATA